MFDHARDEIHFTYLLIWIKYLNPKNVKPPPPPSISSQLVAKVSSKAMIRGRYEVPGTSADMKYSAMAKHTQNLKNLVKYVCLKFGHLFLCQEFSSEYALPSCNYNTKKNACFSRIFLWYNLCPPLCDISILL